MRPPGWLWPTLVAALFLSLLAAGPGVLPGDVAVARAVQSAIPPELTALVEAVNALGRVVPGALGITLAVALLLLRGGHRPAALLVAATLPLRAVNPLLKALVDSPRPSDALVAVGERADGLGFPSGHATGAMLLFGAVIAAAPVFTGSPYQCRSIRFLATLAILVAGICRVVVGAHWPTDVVGGFLWGAVLLGMLVTVMGRPRDDVHRVGRAAGTATASTERDLGARADT